MCTFHKSEKNFFQSTFHQLQHSKYFATNLIFEVDKLTQNNKNRYFIRNTAVLPHYCTKAKNNHPALKYFLKVFTLLLNESKTVVAFAATNNYVVPNVALSIFPFLR